MKVQARGTKGAARHGCAGPAPQAPRKALPVRARWEHRREARAWLEMQGRSAPPRPGPVQGGSPEAGQHLREQALPVKPGVHVDKAGMVCSQMAAKPLLQGKQTSKTNNFSSNLTRDHPLALSTHVPLTEVFLKYTHVVEGILFL